MQDIALEEVDTSRGTVYSGRAVQRVALVLDCLTPHDFSPSEHINLQHYVIRQKRLAEQEALLIFSHVVRVVAMLHKNNVVHRDLKLGNIVLNRRTKKVVLTNFCLGKHLLNEDDLLKDQRGSPAYISPDVLSGKPYLGGSRLPPAAEVSESTRRGRGRRRRAGGAGGYCSRKWGDSGPELAPGDGGYGNLGWETGRVSSRLANSWIVSQCGLPFTPRDDCMQVEYQSVLFNCANVLLTSWNRGDRCPRWPLESVAARGRSRPEIRSDARTGWTLQCHFPG